MGVKRHEKINHKTGNKVTTTVTREGKTTNVRRDLKKSDGLFGTRFLGTEITLSNKTYRKR